LLLFQFFQWVKNYFYDYTSEIQETLAILTSTFEKWKYTTFTTCLADVLLKDFKLLHVDIYPQNAATVVILLKLAGATKKGKLDHL